MPWVYLHPLEPSSDPWLHLITWPETVNILVATIQIQIQI